MTTQLTAEHRNFLAGMFTLWKKLELELTPGNTSDEVAITLTKKDISTLICALEDKFEQFGICIEKFEGKIQ